MDGSFVSRTIDHLFVSKLCWPQAQQYLVPLMLREGLHIVFSELNSHHKSLYHWALYYSDSSSTPGLLIIEQKLVQQSEKQMDADACN